MTPARLLLVDDHTLFREGLAAILNAQPDLEVVAQASDGIEAVVMAQQLRPDLILMDIEMPGMDGLEALLRIRQILPEVRVVMLTVRDDEEALLQAIKYGAQGYLLKDLNSAKVIEMIRGALRGEAALPPLLAARILEEFRRLSQQQFASGGEAATFTPLTAREQEVLTHIAQGKSDKEIAAVLQVSVYTVKTHVRNILAKLQVNSRHEAAHYARKLGLL